MTESDNQTVGSPVPLGYRLQQSFGSLIGRSFDRLLSSIKVGQLSVTWPGGRTSTHGTRVDKPFHNANIVLHNFNPIKQVIRSGENGFAESYLRGDWSTDCLCSLFTLILNNEEEVAKMTTGSRLAQMVNAFRHRRNHNSLGGSKRNIEFHYDLGNDFYQLWLDPTMSYSSAIFNADEVLEEAQRSKLNRVVNVLKPATGSKVLEIGCGWGAMARTLAEDAHCNVEGISLSREQLIYAKENNAIDAASSNGGSTEFRYQDYREVQGRYDHIVSIEMFEAVGEAYWTTYFSKLGDLLGKGGTAMLQVITIAEERFDEYRNTPDFIQRYIFPGGMLPSKTRLLELVDAAGFDLVEPYWFGQSYALTLAKWRDRFDQMSREVQEQGFDERFMRMWRYYLSYCEIGFTTGRTDVGQLLISKR